MTIEKNPKVNANEVVKFDKIVTKVIGFPIKLKIFVILLILYEELIFNNETFRNKLLGDCKKDQLILFFITCIVTNLSCTITIEVQTQ